MVWLTNPPQILRAPAAGGCLMTVRGMLKNCKNIYNLKTHTCAEYMLREWIQHIYVNIAL